MYRKIYSVVLKDLVKFSCIMIHCTLVYAIVNINIQSNSSVQIKTIFISQHQNATHEFMPLSFHCRPQDVYDLQLAWPFLSLQKHVSKTQDYQYI